jgi:hypothetical protein
MAAAVWARTSSDRASARAHARSPNSPRISPASVVASRPASRAPARTRASASRRPVRIFCAQAADVFAHSRAAAATSSGRVARPASVSPSAHAHAASSSARRARAAVWPTAQPSSQISRRTGRSPSRLTARWRRNASAVRTAQSWVWWLSAECAWWASHASARSPSSMSSARAAVMCCSHRAAVVRSRPHAGHGLLGRRP